MEENRYDALIDDMETQQRETNYGTAKWIVRYGICIFVFIALIAINVLLNTLDTIPFIRDMSPLVSFILFPLFSLVLFAFVLSLLLGSGKALWLLDNPPTKEQKLWAKLTRAVDMIIKMDQETEQAEQSDQPDEIKRMIVEQNRELRNEIIQMIDVLIKENSMDTTPEKLIQQKIMVDNHLRRMNTTTDKRIRVKTLRN